MTRQNQDQSLDQWVKTIRDALKAWHQPNHDDAPLGDLYLFRQWQRDERLSNHQATNKLLHEGMEALAKVHQESAGFLQARYLDDQGMRDIAYRLGVSESKAYVYQKEALTRLVETLLNMEGLASFDRKDQMLNRLEAPTYQQLVGADSHLSHLLAQITSSETAYILALTGMGGMGKTALADYLLRHVIEHGPFDNIGWVTARQNELTLMAQIEPVTNGGDTPGQTAETVVRDLVNQLLPDFPLPTNFKLKEAIDVLENHLNRHPHLIVIDNLETIEDVRDLFPTLRRLANPSQFVLTSREQIYDQPNVYHYTVPELSQTDALALIRQEARWTHLPVMAERGDEELLPIVEIVGGNPLALRLVVGLAHHDALDDILGDIKEAHNETADQLYTFIYRQAWDRLSELARQVLTFMPLINLGGDSLDFIVDVSDFNRRDLRKGLSELVTLNLVHVHGEQYDRQYSIHSLTRSFLLEQVIIWQEQ